MSPSLRWGDGLWDAVLNIVAPAQAGAHVRSRNEAARKKNFNVQIFRTPVGLRRDDVWAATSGLYIVVPAQAGTQRLLLNAGTLGLN